jgi:hypothetical protein
MPLQPTSLAHHICGTGETKEQVMVIMQSKFVASLSVEEPTPTSTGRHHMTQMVVMGIFRKSQSAIDRD